MPQGIQVWDAAGVMMLDLSDSTVRDVQGFFISSITTEGEIAVPPVSTNAEVFVINNSGELDTSDSTPEVILDKVNNKLIVTGGSGGSLNIGVRVCEV